jgi:hypothetical protein
MFPVVAMQQDVDLKTQNSKPSILPEESGNIVQQSVSPKSELDKQLDPSIACDNTSELASIKLSPQDDVIAAVPCDQTCKFP